MKIGLDLDDTIFSFMRYYLKRFGSPKDDYTITKNVQRVLSKDRDWWLNQPLLNAPDFIPTLYCTKRVHKKAWTREQLKKNYLPDVPIYQVFTQSASKAKYIKGRVECFVDDSISNFIDLNLSGIPCLLMDSEYNQSWGPIARVYSLKEDEIRDAYEIFLSTGMFTNFKNLIREVRNSKSN